MDAFVTGGSGFIGRELLKPMDGGHPPLISSRALGLALKLLLVGAAGLFWFRRRNGK